jgi:hypothetical protein
MLRKLIRLITAAVMCAAASAAMTESRRPISVQPPRTTGPPLNVALHPPDYGNTADVGGHYAFSVLFAFMLAEAYKAEPEPECQVSANALFPDVGVTLSVPAANAVEVQRRCAAKVTELLTTKEFDRAAFDRAARTNPSRVRPLQDVDSAPGSSVLGISMAPSKVDTARKQLGYLAAFAINRLYADDPAIKALRDHLGWLKRAGGDFDGFQNWLAHQRYGRPLALAVPADWLHGRDEDLSRQLGLKISHRSVIPPLPRPKIGGMTEMSVTSARFRGRKFIMARCDSHSDRYCASKTIVAFCYPDLELAIDRSLPQHSYFSRALRCTAAGYTNVPLGWMAADADDPQIVQRYFDALMTRYLRPASAETALIEDVILVTVD